MSRENEDLWAAMKATADILCLQEEAYKAREQVEAKPIATPTVIYL